MSAAWGQGQAEACYLENDNQQAGREGCQQQLAVSVEALQSARICRLIHQHRPHRPACPLPNPHSKFHTHTAPPILPKLHHNVWKDSTENPQYFENLNPLWLLPPFPKRWRRLSYDPPCHAVKALHVPTAEEKVQMPSVCISNIAGHQNPPDLQ